MRIILAFFLSIPLVTNAQLTWSDGGAELIFENCSVCHNPNSIGPFPLLSYEDVAENAGSISEAIEWPGLWKFGRCSTGSGF